MDAIVLLGDVANIDKKLQKAKRINKKLEERKSKYQEEFQKYNDRQNTDNPEKYKDDIIKILKEKFGNRWKQINNKERISGDVCSFESAENIINAFAIDANVNELKNNFDERLKSYEDIRSDLNFTEEIKQLNFEDIKQLLLHRVEQKQLSPREEEIKQIIQSDQITKNIMEGDSNICPYCFQKLTDEYKKEVLSSLEAIFNPEIQNHRTNLENKKLEIQNSLNYLKDLRDIDKLDKDLFDTIKMKIDNCQTEVTEKLNQKIQNPFVALNLDTNFDNLVNELNRDLDQLEQKRQAFMAQKARANELKQELEKLNNQIAYC